MKLAKYVALLQEIANKHPDLDVIYSCDDEGNRFEKVVYNPSSGNLDEDGSFINSGEGVTPTVVCIN